MSIETISIREGIYYDEDRKAHPYKWRIRAVAERKHGGKCHCPTLDFLHEQYHNDARPRLTALLEATSRSGPRWIDTKFKKVEGTDGLHEFKIFQLRLFCFLDGGDLIICTHGTVKKRDKADPADIKTALAWQRAYFEAKNDNTLRHNET